jgi:vacuolar-type H+-ATPase catalytic subunit A/Vma1
MEELNIEEFKVLLSKAETITESVKLAETSIQKPIPPKMVSYNKAIAKSFLSDKDYQEYQSELKQFETNRRTYEIQIEMYNTNQKLIDSALTEYIKEKSGLTKIPEQYQQKVFDFIQDQYKYGKSTTIFYALSDIVKIFN